MAEVISLHTYPLTGAQAVNRSVAEVRASGIVGDRNFVLYDSSIDPQVEPNRISQKQFPKLATISALFANGELRFSMPDVSGFTNLSEHYEGEPGVVNEFGDMVPVIDQGDQAAERLCAFLGRQNIRIARKSPEWLGDKVYHVRERANAPIHIVTMESVEELQNRAGTDDFGAERFRPNIVISTDNPPFAENEWKGRRIVINGLTLIVKKPTPRCPVPGYDQQTGVNKKDVPKLYRGLEHDSKGKTLFGIYAVPLLSEETVHTIRVNDEVGIED